MTYYTVSFQRTKTKPTGKSSVWAPTKIKRVTYSWAPLFTFTYHQNLRGVIGPVKAEVLIVSWFPALSYVLINTQEASTAEQLLLLISLGRLERTFPNNLASVALQRERIFTCGKQSRRAPVSPGVDIPASLPEGQALRCTEKFDL